MPAIDTTTAPEGALQTHDHVSLWRRAWSYVSRAATARLAIYDTSAVGMVTANPAYTLRGENHRRSQGAVRTKEALVCRWRHSPVTGHLESVWKIERILIPDRE